MDEKLTRWIERIDHAPEEEDPSYQDFIDLLVECRIITEAAS